MSEQVRVDDLEVFSQFRATVLKFAQAAEQSLSNADAQIARTHSWLENEQTNYWQSQHRKRTEAVTQAREAVRQKKLYKDSSGRIPGAVEEEKILKRCLAALEESEYKLLAVRKSIPKLEKEAGLFRGGVSALSRNISGELPKSVALLDRLATRLAEYVQLGMTGAEGGGVSAPAGDGGMSRGDGEAPIVPAVPEVKPEPPPAPLPPGTPEKETPRVADGL